MNYQFDREELETLQFCIENIGVDGAFKLVNRLDDSCHIPLEDITDFHQQFRIQYNSFRNE